MIDTEQERKNETRIAWVWYITVPLVIVLGLIALPH
jgi:hypothetical protein